MRRTHFLLARPVPPAIPSPGPMAARALLVCMLAGSAQAFTFPSSLPLHAQSPSSCHVLKHSRLTLRARKAEEDVRAQESDAQPTSVGAERNWFERTTSADRE
eukprot:756845-Hanusia_phi.AAC.4